MSAYDARKAIAEQALIAQELEDLNGDGVIDEKDVLVAAQSPAVDNGSDDAYGYDTTSTNPKVIDMSQPDIGYHYYRRMADDDDPDGVGEDAQEIIISFKLPKEQEVEIIEHRIIVEGQGQRPIQYDLSKSVIVESLGFQVEPGPHKIQVLNSAAGEAGDSDAAEVRLIVDPDSPTIN